MVAVGKLELVALVVLFVEVVVYAVFVLVSGFVGL